MAPPSERTRTWKQRWLSLGAVAGTFSIGALLLVLGLLLGGREQTAAYAAPPTAVLDPLAIHALAVHAEPVPVYTFAVSPEPLSVAVALDFQIYRDRVEPIFFRDRGGHGPSVSACVTCHVKSATPMRLQPLEEDAAGRVFWTEEQSRRNFEVVSRLVVPGSPESSRLLRQPLAAEAGGSTFHVGGKFWDDQNDPEWQAMAEWVRSAGSTPTSAAATPLVLDFQFFRTCVQRIFLSKREGRMECVNCHGGGARGFAQTLPEGRPFWNEEESLQNYGVLARYVEPGEPMMSRLLTHPLHPEAGGDHFHGGGRRWMSQDDPEWQMLAAWVRGEKPQCVL